jgi:hypothetical protein
LSVREEDDDAVEREELDPAGNDEGGIVGVEDPAGDGLRTGLGGGMGAGESNGDFRSSPVLGAEKVGV